MNSSNEIPSCDDAARASTTAGEATAASTAGKSSRLLKHGERRGWRAILVRQATFDKLKEVMHAQDKRKKALGLAELADGMIGHSLSDTSIIESGVIEGRNRMRQEILDAANEWAD